MSSQWKRLGMPMARSLMIAAVLTSCVVAPPHRRGRYTVVGSWYIAASIAPRPPVREPPPPAPPPSAAPARPTDRPRSAAPAIRLAQEEGTRGMHVENRIYFDHTLEISRRGRKLPRELRGGDSVSEGDRIRATVTTSENAYLYLAFCSQRTLMLYPSLQGIRALAGAPTSAPTSDLVVDAVLGTEVLYLIVSRTQLSEPELARVRTANHTVADCRTAPRAPTVGSAAPRPSPRAAAQNTTPPPPPDPSFERSPGDIASPPYAVATDDDGIAVARYVFKHVAAVPVR